VVVISIDLGYRYVKAVNSRYERVMFPSFVSLAETQGLDGVFGSAGTSRGINLKKLHVILNEYGKSEEYFVGERATWTDNVVAPFGDNKVWAEATKVLVATATGLLTHGHEGSLHVVAGLPLGFFTDQKEELAKFLKELDLTINFAGDLATNRRRVSFDKVSVYPQGYTALVFANEDNGIDLDLEEESWVGLVDIGGKTTDVLMFKLGDGEIDFDTKKCQTFDVGTFEVEDYIRNDFQTKYKRRLDDGEIYGILKTKRYFLDGKKLDMTEVIEEARKKLVEKIDENLNRIWGRTRRALSRTLWVGGGAVDLKEYVESDTSMVIDDAQFANVLGGAYLADSNFRVEKAKACAKMHVASMA